MAEPTARILEDGVHFEWSHVCAHGPDVVMMPHSGGTWRVVQQDPLTVVPSINCLGCGTHGWITDGRWVPA